MFCLSFNDIVSNAMARMYRRAACVLMIELNSTLVAIQDRQ
jgi:hypothetical protein